LLCFLENNGTTFQDGLDHKKKQLKLKSLKNESQIINQESKIDVIPQRELNLQQHTLPFMKSYPLTPPY
jgi:hypothetical protein